MDSTIPVELLELNTRFVTWRTNRKYVREPIPADLWNAAADLSRRYPPSLVGRFYAARRSEARASEPFLLFSRSLPASTPLSRQLFIHAGRKPLVEQRVKSFARSLHSD
jgi:hypothetical protein